MHSRQEKLEALNRVLDVLEELREKCPWDKKQTNESLRPNTIEEVYELCDALMRSDDKEICKELGDVLLHVFFYAKIGEERAQFDLADVCNKLCDKLIFRHPHVYPPADVEAAGARQGIQIETAADVSAQWEQLKQKEKDGNKTVLSGVPQSLPTLIKAYRIQDKARNVGFDWEERAPSVGQSEGRDRGVRNRARAHGQRQSRSRVRRCLVFVDQCGSSLQNQPRQCIGAYQSEIYPPLQLSRIQNLETRSSTY